jgi:hypothetical protein
MTFSAPTGLDPTDPVPVPRTKDPDRERRPWWHYLDVALVVLAMVPAVALGAPVLGYAVGAGGWMLQRAIAETDQRWIRRVDEPVKQLGVSLFEAFGRIWLLAGAIIIAAVAGGHEDGLTAALVIFGAYSVAFAIRVITGPPRRRAVR